MLALLLAGIMFLFLLVGSVVFLLFLLLPPVRRYALSAALWCAVWGPCSITWMLVAGVGLIATAFITKTGDAQTLHYPGLTSVFGWRYLSVGILVTVALATASAYIHQAVVARLTFALFRVYAAVVSASIGSVFGWCFGWWMMAKNTSGHVSMSLWVITMLALIACFGVAAYKGARGLRGEAPDSFTWISPDEFAGR